MRYAALRDEDDTPLGDVDFRRLLQGQLKSMYRLALRLTRDPTRAEDLVQDTVVRALRFRERFKSGTNIGAWLSSILTRQFLTTYRRGRMERKFLHEGGAQDIQEQWSAQGSGQRQRDPENFCVTRLDGEKVLQAMDALPLEYRTVILLCDVQGMSYREIADVMDSPIGTVMSRLNRARRGLRAYLREVDPAQRDATIQAGYSSSLEPKSKEASGSVIPLRRNKAS